MADEIPADVLRRVRSRYPRAYVSGKSGPWGMVRALYEGRVAVVLFATESAARSAARELGAVVEQFSCPIAERCPDLYPD